MHIDGAQIISVWNDLSDDIVPTSVDEWAAINIEASRILQGIPFQKRDLSEFWILSRELRRLIFPVDSFDVGVYLFQGHKFRAWMKSQEDPAASKVYQLSAAELMVAALLIHRDNFHFKRRVSVVQTDPYQQLLREQEGIVGEDQLTIIEGGYKLVRNSIVEFKECETFLIEYHFRTGGAMTEAASQVASPTVTAMTTSTGTGSGSIHTSPAYTPPAYALRLREITSSLGAETTERLVVGRILTEMEMYALGGGVNPQIAPKAVKDVLNTLKLPVNKASARQVLMEMGRKSTPGYSPHFNDITGVGQSGKIPKGW